MRWLDARPASNVDYSWLSGFEYDGATTRCAVSRCKG